MEKKSKILNISNVFLQQDLDNEQFRDSAIVRMKRKLGEQIIDAISDDEIHTVMVVETWEHQSWDFYFTDLDKGLDNQLTISAFID